MSTMTNTMDHLSSASASSSTRAGIDPLNVSFSSSGRPSTTSMPASEICPPGVTSPNGSLNPWEVHKFGGASLADATLYRTVGDLLVRESAGRLGEFAHSACFLLLGESNNDICFVAVIFLIIRVFVQFWEYNILQ